MTALEIGGRAIRVVRPGDPDRLLDDPAVLDWNRRDDYMPYWAYLWPGAYLLAEVVMREPWPDLGPGTGPFTSTYSRSVAGSAWPAWQHWPEAVLFFSPTTTRRRSTSSREAPPKIAST